MESRGEEAEALSVAGGASGVLPAEHGSDGAAASAEPQAPPGRAEEGPVAPAAPAAAPAAAGATGGACSLEVPGPAHAVAPAGAEEDGDGGPDSPADFFGFFVDVHKNLAKELGDEFQRIPEASGKICTRLGLPICAQMRSSITKGDGQPPASPASPPPPQQKA